MSNTTHISDDSPLHIVWFRQDLRLHDNPAYHAACQNKARIIAIYILDDDAAGQWARGAASRWWLHHALNDLDDALEGNLHVFSGNAQDILLWLTQKTGATTLHFNACYEPWRIAQDDEIRDALMQHDVDSISHQAGILFHPDTIKNGSGDPYKVFSYFYKNGCLKQSNTPRPPLPLPDQRRFAEFDHDTNIDDLQLLPRITWDEHIAKRWKVGEEAAKEQFERFLKCGLKEYHEVRNRPDKDGTSSLSPYLHYGHISPYQIWHGVKDYAASHNIDKGAEVYLSEIGWREFSHYILYFFPHLPDNNFQEKFDAFEWESRSDYLQAWQRGKTGYPIVDAGMRQLWKEGWMHNRVRMIVGSFLVKDLLIDWREGEKWFWDTLVDADLANNAMGWQWIAGSGTDASPFFRIFNPVSQAEKFDPNGDYVRTYVPELKKLNKKQIHKPWEVSQGDLEKAGIVLGKHYPKPIVNHSDARDEALKRFKQISGK